MSFAKIFDVPFFGQVLAVADANAKGEPELRWSVRLEELGVCSIALGFKDTDAGWDDRDAAFNKADQSEALDAAKAIYRAAQLEYP